MREPKFDVSSKDKSQKEIDYTTKKSIELKSFLEKIDLDSLISVFEEIYKKATLYEGTEKDVSDLDFFKFKMSKIFKERIEAVYSGRMGKQGGRNIYGGFIFVSTKSINNEVYLYRVVFHEFVHSFCINMGVKEFSNDGLMFQGDKEDGWRMLYQGLNEAVTELMTDYIFSEYSKRSGLRSDIKGVDKKFKANKAYKKERIAIQKCINTISKKFTVPKNVVLMAMFGHYVRGDFKKALELMTKEEKEIFEIGTLINKVME